MSPLIVLGERPLAEGAAQSQPAPNPYVATLVEGVVAHQARIDELLSTYSSGWALDRMPAVDRNILRIGVFELLWCDDVPDAVVIDEAVNLRARAVDRRVPGVRQRRAGPDPRPAPAPGRLSPHPSRSRAGPLVRRPIGPLSARTGLVVVRIRERGTSGRWTDRGCGSGRCAAETAYLGGEELHRDAVRVPAGDRPAVGNVLDRSPDRPRSRRGAAAHRRTSASSRHPRPTWSSPTRSWAKASPARVPAWAVTPMTNPLDHCIRTRSHPGPARRMATAGPRSALVPRRAAVDVGDGEGQVVDRSVGSSGPMDSSWSAVMGASHHIGHHESGPSAPARITRGAIARRVSTDATRVPRVGFEPTLDGF